jgi:hypothetical protein
VDVIELRATALNAGLKAESAPFVGPLDPGGSAPLDLALTPSKGGTIQLRIHVAYRDDLNQVQTWIGSLAFEVAEEPLPVPQAGTPGEPERKHAPAFWQALLRAAKGFVGLGS